MTTIVEIPIAHIEPDPKNSRTSLGDLTWLADSIRVHGVQQPLKVRPLRKDRYQVVFGHRRLAAARLATKLTVPCMVEERPPEQLVEIQIVENLHREDLPPLDEARAFQRLLDEFGWAQERIAERIGCSQSHVSKRLSLLALTPKARKALDSGGMTVGDALELAKLADDPKRMDQALGQATQWNPLPRVIAGHLDERERERKLAAAIEQAEADPAPYLPAVSGQYRGDWRPPKGARALSTKDEGFDPLGIPPAKHRKEPCHAVTVIPRLYGAGPKLMYICTDPKRHPEGKKNSNAALAREISKVELAEQERRKALAAAAKDRRVFVGSLPGKLTRNAAEDLIIDELIRASHQSVLKIACELLEIEPRRVTSLYGGAQWNYEAPLRQAGRQSQKAGQRVALGIVFASAEERAVAGWIGWGNLRSYFTLLEANGYEITEAERTKLEAEKNDVDGDDVASCRICGCTEDEACEGGCSWVTDPEGMGDLCSQCLEKNYAAGELQEAEA